MEKYYKWEFTLKDGKTISAFFTNSEINIFRKLHPEVKWNE